MTTNPDGSTTELKLKYFVLNPYSKNRDYALASRAAIVAYSWEIQSTNPDLGNELRDWMEQVTKEDGYESIPNSGD